MQCIPFCYSAPFCYICIVHQESPQRTRRNEVTFRLRTLFIEDIVAPGIVGAAVELSIFPVSQNKTATTSRTSAAGHSCVPALLVSIDISKVLFTVGFRGGDYLKKPSAIEAHLIRRKNYIPVLLNVWHHVVHIQDRLLCRHIDVGITWENDNPIDRDIIPKYKPSQSLDRTAFRQGIPQSED